MGMYQHIRALYTNPQENLGGLWQQRLIKMRREPTILALERPTRLDRARALGYKAKQGFLIVRVRVKRGGRKRELIKGGRKTRQMRRRKILSMNYQWVAEGRAQRYHSNLEVLNSYWLAKDGLYHWYEVIMVDPHRPEIKSDAHINWICTTKHRNRVFRGKTSAAKKSRGLRHTGKGAEKS
ncbi:50S ribosomal protein L15e [Candidatus Woesearchaeota archaeon]|nr:50S ribosomal protein L15e [Candidatus Woesearchaeota archaeon]